MMFALLLFFVNLLLMILIPVIYARLVRRRPEVRTHFDAQMLRDVPLSEPDPFAALDALLKTTSLSAVLADLPASIRDDFTPAGLPCRNPRRPGVPEHQWLAAHLDGTIRSHQATWRCKNCTATTSNHSLVARHLAVLRGIAAADLSRERERALAAALHIEPQRMWVNYDQPKISHSDPFSMHRMVLERELRLAQEPRG